MDANSPEIERKDMETFMAAIEKYQNEIDLDMEAREGVRSVVRDLEKATKKIYFVCFGIHADPTELNLKATGEKMKELLGSSIRPLITNLKEKIPAGEYYRFNDHFKNTFQRLSFLSVLSHYLLTGCIQTIEETAGSIGLKSIVEKGDETIVLDYDDYLIGLLEVTSEFSRFCRNCITFGGEIKRVYNIHESMSQLNAGMHNITFKNDYLRRRYDGLKYNIKAVEEVIYDLKMRGLTDAMQTTGPSTASPSQ